MTPQNIDAATLEFAREHREDDVRQLMLSQGRFPGIDMRMAATQIEGWQLARAKLPTWAATDGVWFPPRLSMEQCSSEATARYKQRFVPVAAGETLRLADLTGGFGVDAAMMACGRGFALLTVAEPSALLCTLLRHNLPLLGVVQSEVACTTAEQLLPTLPQQDLIMLDPSRRDAHGGKVVELADCVPNILEINDLLLQKSPLVLLKLSPMLDIRRAAQQLHGVAEIHVVSLEGECKELLVLLRRNALNVSDPRLFCVNLMQKPSQGGRTLLDPIIAFTAAEERSAVCHMAEEPQSWLYEPNASLLKAGAFRTVAMVFDVSPLAPSSHLYTSAEPVPNFPGRTFRIVGFSTLQKQPLRQLLSGLQRANLTVRNFPQSVAELRKRLHLGEGGDDYLFATTLSDGRKVIIRCRKP